MSIQQQIRLIIQSISIFGIIMLAFMLAITNRIKRLEQEKAENYVRIQREISDLNTKVNYPGG